MFQLVMNYALDIINFTAYNLMMFLTFKHNAKSKFQLTQLVNYLKVELKI